MASAIVTGAGGGIGRAIALKLAALGFNVALAGRTIAPLERTADEVRAAGRRALVVAADVSVSGQAGGLVERTCAEFGGVDVLVNNAGFAPMAALCETTDEQWRKILEVNLSAAFYLTRAVWPVMRRQYEQRQAELRGKPGAEGARMDGSIAGGVIVNISSRAARDPFPGLGAYGAAKAGVNLLTLASAREGAAAGIRVFCIAPGAVETPMLRGLFSTEQLPAEKAMRPGEIADVVGAFVEGTLRNASGETIYLQRG